MLKAVLIASALAHAAPPEASPDARAACEQLSYSYAAAVDGNDPDGLAGLFATDGRWQLSAEPMIGQAAIRAYLTDFVKRKTGASLHVITNVQIVMTGPDTASGTAYAQIYALAKGEKAGAPRGLGIYRDKFVRSAQGWRFAERILDRISS